MEGYYMPQNNPGLSELFNTQYAAGYLGVTPKTLEVWRCTKRYNIPYIKVGRLVKYRKADLDAFLESRTVGAEG
jgi:excisionase family DNA binding protein